MTIVTLYIFVRSGFKCLIFFSEESIFSFFLFFFLSSQIRQNNVCTSFTIPFMNFSVIVSLFVKVCDHGISIQLQCFWTVSIILFYLEHNISETGFYPCLQVKAHSDRASPYLWTPAPTQDRIYKPNTTQTVSERRQTLKALKKLHAHEAQHIWPCITSQPVVIPYVKGISEKFRRIVTISMSGPSSKLNIHSMGY